MDGLKNWILQCGFSADRDEAEEIAKIIYKGRLRGTWDFFAKRIRMKNEIDNIRGNLILQETQKKYMDKKEVEETDDIYEKNVLAKSLTKVIKKTAQTDHDIQRLKTICFDLNSKKDVLKKKLLNSSSKNGQLIDHQENLANFLRKISRHTFEIEQWMTSKWEYGSNDSSQVLSMCVDCKSIIHKTLQEGCSSEFDALKISCINPGAVINGLIEATRNTGAKVQVELNKSVNAKSSNNKNLQPLLEDLWNDHVESYQNYQSSFQQMEIFQQEVSRHLDQHLSNVQDELIKRYINMKKSQKAGHAFITSLNKQLCAMELENDDDLRIKKLITDRYAIVEKQSKDMLGKKMLIEELLGHTSNHRERVSHLCDQLHQQKIDMSQSFGIELPILLDANHGLASDALKSVHVASMSDEFSIDRSGKDTRIIQFNQSINLFIKPNFCQLLQHVFHTMMHNNLLGIYINEMNKFKNFGHTTASPEEILEELSSSLLKEKSTVCELIKKKLQKHEAEESRKSCDKFKHAVNIWTTEPGKDAFIHGLNPSYKGKSLNEWYDAMKGNVN